jgi:hypothetical protein
LNINVVEYLDYNCFSQKFLTNTAHKKRILNKQNQLTLKQHSTLIIKGYNFDVLEILGNGILLLALHTCLFVG